MAETNTTLYGLYYEESPNEESGILFAISFDKIKLCEILNTFEIDLDKSNFIIKPIIIKSIYQLDFNSETNKTKENDKFRESLLAGLKKNLFGKNNDIMRTQINDNSLQKFSLDNKFYATNTKTGQSIIYIPHDEAYDSTAYVNHINKLTDEYFGYNLSRNFILLDTLYEEGVMNA